MNDAVEKYLRQEFVSACDKLELDISYGGWRYFGASIDGDRRAYQVIPPSGMSPQDIENTRRALEHTLARAMIGCQVKVSIFEY